MLIAAHTRPAHLRERGLRWSSGERFDVGWKGHLAWPGETAGVQSARRLAKALERAPLDAAMSSLAGVFGLFVYDRLTQTWQIAGDNAGLYKIYHDGRRVSTSFLELARGRTVSSERAVEFICHGGIYGAGTLVEGISKLQAAETISLRPALTLHRKDLDAGDGEIIGRFGAVARSCVGLKISVDLTGGLDSRLNAVFFRSAGLDCEAAVASWTDDVPDVTLARRVADRLGWPLHVSRHELDRLEADLVPAFRDGDGQLELWSWHKDRQNALARLARGVHVAVHGGGGNGFSDSYFAHEFPFYEKKDVCFRRFYDLRVLPTPPDFIDAGMLQDLRARTIARFEEHRAPSAAQSCDAARFFVRAPEQYGHQLSAYINLGLDVATPYLDYQMVQAAMRMPPWSRFHSGWHRRTMTALNAEVAALPTTSGHSASTELRHMLPDMVGLVREKARCVARKLGQRHLGRAIFSRPEPIHPGYIRRLRASGVARTAIERVKAIGVLAPSLDPGAIGDRFFARAVTLGMSLDHVEHRHPIRVDELMMMERLCAAEQARHPAFHENAFSR